MRSPLGARVPQPGDRFGDFTLRRELGRGAMGVVWEAWQESLAREVALKVLGAEVGADPTWVARFQAEAGQAARLSHPGILPVHAVGETAGLHWFAMEKVDGEDLAKRLERNGPLPFDEAARLVRDAARALHHAHQRGVIHRDVKPANLMLRRDGRVVVTDFGLSKELGSGALTTTGLLVGTPYYMSPELVRGDPAKVGPRADLYGLGVTLYELLTGQPPFRAETAVALLKQIAEAEPLPPSRHRAGLPRDLETIVLTCLAKEPARRYADGEQLAADLDRFLSHEPISRRRAGLWERALRQVQRHRTAYAVGGAALLVVLALTLLFRGEMQTREAAFQEEIERLHREADELAEAGEEAESDARHARIAALAAQGPEAARAAGLAMSRDLVADLRAGRPLRAEYQQAIQDWARQAPARITLVSDPPGAVAVGRRAVVGVETEEPLALEGGDLVPGLWRLKVAAPGRLRTTLALLAPPGVTATLRVALPPDDGAAAGMLSYGGAWFPDPAGGTGLVALQSPYLLDAERVTARDYAAFRGTRPAGPPDGPVLGLTRAEAEAYARSQGKRLPTDMELILATAPAKVPALVKSVVVGRPRGDDMKARLAEALAQAGEDLAASEGLRGWDGRPEWALTQREQALGEAAPWPRPARGGGSRPRETKERALDVALRLAR
jgi:hypothetical protein